MLTLIRSTLFNLIFYTLTAIECVLLLPTLFLPKRYYIATVFIFVHITAFLEKYILGLHYEVRGIENLPDEGPYIIAAKHQSSYETFKLHFLFGDPAIVLKKELLKIPLWGRYLGKSDPIAIDRKTPKEAIKSLKSESIRVAEQKRPIVIFPQGTRVSINHSAQDKPYKIGIMRIQEATKLPIIPLALNTGYFYPKHKWCKKPGTVIFEFLPPIPYEENTELSAGLNRLEMRLEEKSAELLAEAKSSRLSIAKRVLNYAALMSVFLFALYTVAWFTAAAMIKDHTRQFISDLDANPLIVEHNLNVPEIKGYPLALNAKLSDIEITARYEAFSLKELHAKTWPIPGAHLNITAKTIGISSRKWLDAITIDHVDGAAILKPEGFELVSSDINAYDAHILINGQFDLMTKRYPMVDLNIEIQNFEEIIRRLFKAGVLDQQKANFALMGLRAASDKNGSVRTTLISHENALYLHGMLKIYSFAGE